MKRLCLLLSILASAAAASAAEPWICTREGARLIYEESLAGTTISTLDKRVAVGDNGEITLTYTKEGFPIVERWRVYPDSTVLQIEAPKEMYALLDTLQVRDVEVRMRNLSLPAVLNPGDILPGFGFSLSGTRKGERSTISVVSDSIRVIGPERIKTPAGRFDAVRIESRTVTTIGSDEQEGRMTQWLVPGVGIVRQEIPVYGTVVVASELKKITQ